jgi:hypothetical protein
MEDERGFYSRIDKTARQHLDRLGGQLKQRAVRWCAEVLYGNRGPEVVRFAAGSDIDLIVLTSPRLDPANHTDAFSPA